MEPKVELKSRITYYDLTILYGVFNDMYSLWEPWRYFSELFTGFTMEELQVFILDYRFFLLSAKKEHRIINLKDLLSFKTSIELMRSRFDVCHLETGSNAYDVLDKCAGKLQKLYDGYFNSKDED